MKEFGKKSPDKILKSLLKESEKINPLIIIDEEIEIIRKKKALRNILEKRGVSAEDIKKQIKQNREQLTDLNFLWIKNMASGQSMLREKMTFFWHGHFACRLRQPLL